MARVILHVDMDAFYASVEQHDRPELRGLPVVVGAAPQERGVVAAASYEARRFGIHSAMPSREAAARCPQAVFVTPRMQRYQDVSHQIFAIMERFSPVIEPLSLDEAFLDVTGSQRLFGSGPEIARRIKKAILAGTGLTASAGVAANKFLAKLASDLQKPDGLTVVPETREDILAFLAPLPVRRLWGVGTVTAEILEREGLRTIGHLQGLAEPALAAVVGRHAARHLLRLAMGEDARDVEVDRLEASMSREHTFPRDCTDAEALQTLLGDLVEDVGRRLRASGKFAGVAHLKLRWRGFKTITRQCPLDPPCCDDISLRHRAQALLAAIPLTQPVRLIGFGVSRLEAAPARQLALFEAAPAETRRREQLSRTVDQIRQRHGRDSIRRGASAGAGPDS